MPETAAQLMREQLIIMQLLDEQAADARASLFPGVRHATFHELREVLRVVHTGHLRSRPVTASAISRRTGIPRATIARRLALLLRMGHIQRLGPHTYGSSADFHQTHRREFVVRSVKRVLAAAAKLTQA